MDSKDEDYRSIPTRPTRAKRKLLGSLLGMNAIAAPSTLSHQQYSNPIRGSASTSSDKVTPFSRPSTPPVHATQRFLHCTFCKGLARCRLAWLSLSLFLRSSPKLTVTETSIHQASSGLLMADWCLLGQMGRLSFATLTFSSPHTHTSTHDINYQVIHHLYNVLVCLCVCVGVCIYR